MPRTRATASGVSVPTAAEVVIATLPPITLQANNTVDLLAEVDLSTGTGVTGSTITIRRGTTITGTVVQAIGPVPPAASTRGLLVVEAQDTQAVDVAGQQYVVTITTPGSSSASTANYGEIRADWTAPGTV